ncbi:MAG: hypothetical protein WCO26_15350 [Deltaproteobacteria bacterium]
MTTHPDYSDMGGKKKRLEYWKEKRNWNNGMLECWVKRRTRNNGMLEYWEEIKKNGRKRN